MTTNPDWPSQDAAAMNAFYGNPDRNGDGFPDRQWEDRNLVFIKPPYEMVLAWDTTKNVTRLRVHKAIATSLTRCLIGVLDTYPNRQDLRRFGLHLWGGAYMFRLKRGGSTLSIHSWGAAVDINPTVNWYGRRYGEHLGMMPQKVVRIFADEGWTWGGLWRKPDAMHFQAADV